MNKSPIFIFVIFLFVFAAFTRVDAQTTEFVYQGQLQNSSVPANGSFDFEFLLYNALSGGTQIGSTLTKGGVAVANGVFSVPLDFGSSYPGANRFLEIHVRQAGGGAFTPLTPRQAVSNTPYAVKSLTADTATNATQLGGLTSGGFIQNGTAQQPSSNFNISGNGVVGGRFGVGTTPSAFKLEVVDSSNAGLRVQTNAFGGTVASFGGNGDFQIDAPGIPGGRLNVKENGNVGIGTTAPEQRLHVDGNEILSTGSSAGFKFRDRGSVSSGDDWVWYSTGNIARFFRAGSGDLLNVQTNGNLKAAGTIQSNSGGFKFPDGSMQTTAANATYTTVRTDLIGVTTGPLASILHLNLPTGTYLLSATANFVNFAGYFGQDNRRIIHCVFSGEQVTYPYSNSLAAPGTLSTSLTTTFHSVLTISSGGVDFQCHGFQSDQDLISVGPRRLTAVKIEGSVFVQ